MMRMVTQISRFASRLVGGARGLKTHEPPTDCPIQWQRQQTWSINVTIRRSMSVTAWSKREKPSRFWRKHTLNKMIVWTLALLEEGKWSIWDKNRKWILWRQMWMGLRKSVFSVQNRRFSVANRRSVCASTPVVSTILIGSRWNCPCPDWIHLEQEIVSVTFSYMEIERRRRIQLMCPRSLRFRYRIKRFWQNQCEYHLC